jgi:hypothetical protein
MNELSESLITENVEPSSQSYSLVIRPFWYVALMMIMTLGAYRVVWLYRTWPVLIKHYKLPYSTIINILFDPLFSYIYFKNSFSLGKEAGYRPIMPPIIASLLYSIFLIAKNLSWQIRHYENDDSYLLTVIVGLVLMLIPMKDAVNAFNAGYLKIKPDTRIRTKLSLLSTVIVFLGSLIWAYFISLILDNYNIINIDMG